MLDGAKNPRNQETPDLEDRMKFGQAMQDIKVCKLILQAVPKSVFCILLETYAKPITTSNCLQGKNVDKNTSKRRNTLFVYKHLYL